MMADWHHTFFQGQPGEEGKGKGKRCTPFLCVGIIDTDGQVSECLCTHEAFHDPVMDTGSDLNYPVGPGHHVRQRIRRASDAADPLDNPVSLNGNTRDSYRCTGREPDLDLCIPGPGAFAQECSVPADAGEDASRPGMVKTAERRTRTAQALVEDLDPVPVGCCKDTPARALRNRRNCSIPCSGPPGFFFPDHDTTFADKPDYPVLCSTPGYAGCLLDVGYRKKTGVLRELAHQAQVFSPVFKHAGHSGRGCTGYRR